MCHCLPLRNTSASIIGPLNPVALFVLLLPPALSGTYTSLAMASWQDPSGYHSPHPFLFVQVSQDSDLLVLSSFDAWPPHQLFRLRVFMEASAMHGGEGEAFS